MADERFVDDVLLRFEDEQRHVQQYIEFLKVKSDISYDTIRGMNMTLKRSGISLLPKRQGDRHSLPYSDSEISNLLNAIDQVAQEIPHAVNLIQSQINAESSWYMSDASEQNSDYFLELVVHLQEEYNENPSNEEIERECELAAETLLRQGDSDISEEDVHAVVKDAFQHLKIRRLKRRQITLRCMLEEFDDLRLRAKVIAPGASLNVLRQGFILLMTTFDAAVFDLVKIGFSTNFICLLSAFAKNDKFVPNDIVKAGSLESFREEMTQDSLKGRYLKDLLYSLHRPVGCSGRGFQVNFPELASSQDVFVRLIEMVMRRNIHVHNRGIVDKRYLDLNENGKPHLNLDNLKIGEVASIDQAYWDRANVICQDCIKRLAAWVNGLPRST